MGRGILEDASGSKTSEWRNLGESIGEVRDEASGKTSDGGVCERHLDGAFVGMQWEGWIWEDAFGEDGENNWERGHQEVGKKHRCWNAFGKTKAP